MFVIITMMTEDQRGLNDHLKCVRRQLLAERIHEPCDLEGLYQHAELVWPALQDFFDGGIGLMRCCKKQAVHTSL